MLVRALHCTCGVATCKLPHTAVGGVQSVLLGSAHGMQR